MNGFRHMTRLRFEVSQKHQEHAWDYDIQSVWAATENRICSPESRTLWKMMQARKIYCRHAILRLPRPFAFLTNLKTAEESGRQGVFAGRTSCREQAGVNVTLRSQFRRSAVADDPSIGKNQDSGE